MARVLLVLLLWPLMWLQGQGQINYAEFFVNRDPGYGNGTPISLTAANAVALDFNVPLAQLDPGVHTLHVRTRDAAQQWSATATHAFYIPAMPEGGQRIAYVEYFVGTDPGLGNGTSIALLASGGVVDLDFVANLQDLAFGLHTLGIRTRDEKGNWSQTSTHVFLLNANVTAKQVVRAEYFVDNDPGFGNGMAIPISPSGASVSVDFSVDVTNLAEGVHTLYIRTQDDQGNWSLTANHAFLLREGRLADEIVALTYKFVRPDFESKTITHTLQSPAASVELDLDIDLSGLPGDHEYELHIYAVSGSGEVGLVRVEKIRVCEGLPVTAAFDHIAVGTEVSFIDDTENAIEYLWDFGDGNTSTVSNPVHRYAKGGNYEVTLTASSFCNSETFTMTISPVELQRVHPERGGNGGNVTLTIWGAGFNENTTVRLVRGAREIVGFNQGTAEAGKVLYAAFDLRDAALGGYDIVVTNPGFTGTLPASFTVEGAIAPSVSISITGRDIFRPGWVNRYTANYTNTGNNDLYMVPITIVYQKNAEVSVANTVLTLANDVESVSLVEETALEIDYVDDVAYISLIVPHIPANSSGQIDFDYVAKEEGDFDLTVIAGIPMLDASDVFLGNAGQQRTDLADNLHASQTDGANCVSAVSSAALAVLDGVAAVVPVRCAVALTASTVSLASTVLDIISRQRSGERGLKPALVSTGGLVHGVLLSLVPTGLECFKDFGPIGKIYKLAYAGVGLVVAGVNLYDQRASCFNMISTASKRLRSVASFDPNEKVGPVTGTDGNHLQGYAPLNYTIFFENLPAATAPAQEVVVVDQIDTEVLDLSTLHLTGFGFGNDVSVTIPAGRDTYSTTVDLRPKKNLIVRVDAKLDRQSGTLTWRFLSLDPETMELTDDPLDGFLPPNRTPKEGEGYVSFSIHTVGGLATGVRIENEATIYFDNNKPIETNTFLNTIDKVPPVSRVRALPEKTAELTFAVSWSGTDEGAGVRSYDVYVAKDDDAFALWQYGVSATSAEFTGENGATYRFYSVAHDHAGNQEPTKNAAEAQITIEQRKAQTIDFGPLANVTYGAAAIAPAATASSGLPIAYSSSNTAVASLTAEGTIRILKPGVTTITASQPGNNDYWPAEPVSRQLTVNKAPLTIGVAPASRVYGETNPAFEAVYEGFIAGDGVEKLTALPRFSTTAGTMADVGAYPVTVTAATSDFYAVRFVDGTLTVNKASQTISFAPIPVLQRRGTGYELEVSASSGLPVTLAMPDRLQATLAGNLLTPLRVGTGEITASQPGDGNYLPATAVVQPFRVTDEQDAVVRVHPAVSPDGDGMNDFLVIEGIEDYPDNAVSIFDRNGLKLFDTKGYDNSVRVFKGMNKSGKLVPQGTYFYVVEFKRDGDNERLTGYFVIRY